ncbi:MAG: gfo/Idh/MocA family oxidoreductase, partial [Rhizobiaceae bacterium]|nr:gfo/Idh/MocA family oxidoreductase [Hyphomicrobiales bacterium]NRB32354.1 gfo/Idh/MocA family oxidoreductase [Rhizobiaceae bacterium]
WLDTFRYMLGNPTHLYCDLRRMNDHIAGEDAGILILDFDDGMRAVLDANRCLDHASKNPRLTFGECKIEGEKGTLSLNGAGEVWHRSFGSTKASLLLAKRHWPGFAGDCVFALQKHVVDHILSGTPLENSVSDYIPVMELEMMAYQSAEQGRKFRV